MAKVLCSLVTGGIQLILAYSWARPAILVAGMDRGGMFYFFCFFTFILVLLSCLSLSLISSTISFISLLPFSGRQHRTTRNYHKGWCVIKDICEKYFLHCKPLKTLHIFSFIYWLTIFKIKMIRYCAKSFTVWPGMTPPLTVFPKICANNYVSWLYDKNSFHLAFNFIILSRTIQEMILIHICCSFIKMRQESAMPIFDTS